MAPIKEKQFVAILDRWQPVHLGRQAVLTALCSRFNRVVIGIGSSNIHNYRKPFAITEVVKMIRLSLKAYNNFSLVPIPDLVDDQE